MRNREKVHLKIQAHSHPVGGPDPRVAGIDLGRIVKAENLPLIPQSERRSGAVESRPPEAANLVQ